MKNFLVIGSAIFNAIAFSSSVAQTPTSTSASYSLLPAVPGAGGGTASAATVSAEISIGDGIAGGVTNVTLNGVQAKQGYTGQLHDVTAVAIKGDASPMDEGGPARQLGADLVLDDDTRFVDVENSELAWSEESDTLVTLSPAGLVTVVAAYEDTTVNIQATWQGVPDPDGFDIPVRNLGTDDFPGYDGDQLDDAWQFTFFGAPPNAKAGPAKDPDFDGRDNRYEELTGFSPVDGADFLRLEIAEVNRGEGTADLRLNRVIPGRLYSLRSGNDLKTFTPVGTAFSVTDEEADKVFADVSAAGPVKFFDAVVTRP